MSHLRKRVKKNPDLGLGFFRRFAPSEQTWNLIPGKLSVGKIGLALFPFLGIIASHMPLYEYECAKGHRFETVQKVKQRPLTKCSVCSARAKRILSQPTLLHNRGIHVFDRVTKDDVLHSRPSSLKSLKKDKF